MRDEYSNCFPSFSFRIHLIQLLLLFLFVFFGSRYQFYNTLTTTGPLYDTLNTDYGTWC
jgi:hypothetical protein